MRRVESEDAEYGENPDGEEAKGWAEFCDEGCGERWLELYLQKFTTQQLKTSIGKKKNEHYCFRNTERYRVTIHGLLEMNGISDTL